MECPSCGEPAPEGANWCEACGSDLAAEPSAPCVECGERDISDDGYCMTCGHKQPEERDHLVFEAGPSVAVTDRGLRHRHNEDSAAIGTLADGGAVLVVCDGVSSTPGSAEASMAAATAARDLLVERLTEAPDSVTDALLAATEIAQQQAAAAPEVFSNAPHSQGGPPSSTFVAATARPAADGIELSVAWLGDSRAYWLENGEALQLTVDHELTGSLTRWLGADSVDTEPDVATHLGGPAGRLLLCSDGLWRYADPPGELAELVGRLESEHTTTLALAGALVTHAVESGGHDNITVALWEAPAAVPAGPPTEAAETEAPEAKAPVATDPEARASVPRASVSRESEAIDE